MSEVSHLFNCLSPPGACQLIQGGDLHKSVLLTHMLTDFSTSFSDSSSPRHSSGPHSTIKFPQTYSPSSLPIIYPYKFHSPTPFSVPTPSGPAPAFPGPSCPPAPITLPSPLRKHPKSQVPSSNLGQPRTSPAPIGRLPHLDSDPYHLSLLLLNRRRRGSPTRRGRSRASQVGTPRGRRHHAATCFRVKVDSSPPNTAGTPECAR